MQCRFLALFANYDNSSAPYQSSRYLCKIDFISLFHCGSIIVFHRPYTYICTCTYDERSIGDTWEQRKMLTWCGFTVALKKGSARGCLYLGKGGGSCQCLWIAVECVWKTWKGNSIPGLLSDGMLISKFVYCNVESHWTNVHLLLHSTAFRSRSFIGSKTVLL